VIYPPIREDILANSVCYSSYHNTTTQDSSDTHSTFEYSSVDSSEDSTISPVMHRRRSDKDDPFTFLYIGRLAVEKQPGLLIKAVLYIMQQSTYIKGKVTLMDATDIDTFRRNIKVIICGDGELMYVLKDTVMSVGLNDVIVFQGHLDHKQLNQVIQRSDVLVNPIVKGMK